MALKASVSKDVWEKLPEAIQAEYSEKDGKYLLQVTAVDGVALEDSKSPSGAHSALKKERARVKELEAQVEAFGDIDPESAKDALAKVGDISKWTPEQKVKEQIEANARQLSEKHKRELEARDATIKARDAQLERVLITNAATDAILKAKGRTKGLLPMVKAATRLEKDSTTGEYVARVFDPDTGMTLVTKREGRHEPMTLEEFVDGMRGDEDLAGLFDAPDASGSGNEPAGKKQSGGGKKTVDANDFEAMSDNLDAIASGEVEVVSK